jgi:ATP-binding cassette subfamily B protein
MLLLVATVLKGVFMFLMRQSLIVMSRFVEYDLKNEIFSKLQKLPMGFYKHAHTGDVMSRMSEDVGHVRMYVGPSLMYLINLMVMSVMVIYAMFSVNTVLACWVLLPLPFLSLVVYAISRIIQKQSTRIQSQVGWISTLAQETFSGIRVVQSLAAGPEFKKRMQQEGEKYFQYTTQQIFTEALYQPAIGFLIGLSVLLTVLVGGILVSKGEITPGNIAEFILYVYMLTWPFTSLGWVSALMQKAAASMRRINQLLDTEEAPLIRLSASEQISKSNISLKQSLFSMPVCSSRHYIGFR